MVLRTRDAVGIDMHWLVIPAHGDGPLTWQFSPELGLPSRNDAADNWSRVVAALSSQRHAFEATQIFHDDLAAAVALLQAADVDRGAFAPAFGPCYGKRSRLSNVLSAGIARCISAALTIALPPGFIRCS